MSIRPPLPGILVWPAIIKHEGDDELSYVASSQQWLDSPDLNACPYQDADCLIDAQGYIFELFYSRSHNTVTISPAHKQISLARFSELVQTHLAVLAQCCLSKVTFSSYQQGFDLLASTLEPD